MSSEDNSIKLICFFSKSFEANAKANLSLNISDSDKFFLYFFE
jgi:hypothetical protein